jgi:osmoprotectant transport system permease protein
VIATATLAAYVDAGGLGRYIVDGFAVQDNVKVFVGGLLVALLAVTVELILAFVQRHLVSKGLDVRVSVGG